MANDQQDAAAGDAADLPLVVVGVGVCAASVRSLGRMFADLAPGIGAAYLVAVRQLEGLDVGSVLALLSDRSPLPVKIAEDGEPLRADHIYLGGSDDMITVSDGHLGVRPAAEPVGHRGTIDSLLISLAEDFHERAVAVILAGLGTDGSAGVTATKKFGGLSVAELAEGAEAAGQDAVGPFGVADLRLHADAIAPQVALYAASLSTLGETPEEVSDEIEAQVTQIATVMRNVTGHDFHGYKRGTFVRRVQRRMQVMQVDTVPDYLSRLREDRDEVQALFQDLLIGVTQFFRDPSEFEALERELPRLFEGKGAGATLRVWVLGCATGEEAYSIAILLREHMAGLDHPPDVQIFATDLDARALNLARAGRYTDTIAEHVRPDRLDRWFVREGDTYCVSKELREMCIFSPHNIVKDAPFSRIDILSCRNLLIYLNADLQNRVIPIFHFSLRPGGILFLGSSENVTRHAKLFAPVDRRNRLFRRVETDTRIIPDFPLTPRARLLEPGGPAVLPAVSPSRLGVAIGRQAEAVAERYAPAYIVVDQHFDVLHFSGRTGRYLDPSAGAATLNLLNLVHRDLRLDLRSALHRALAEGRRMELPRLTVHADDRAYLLNLVVEPVGGADTTSFLVLFQDIGQPAEGDGQSGDRLHTDEHVQRLEAELRVTRDRLQATIEELESTNEELKSSNEEYQSINEELQSANEEMETSKEELQSVNEELQTVNGELSHRVSELARANSDLKNLLESTQIATVFLDNDLRIRNFTPVATDIFHLHENDIGRPLDHVVARVAYPELSADVRRVMKTLAPVERAVTDDAQDRHFVARVLPYRSTDNYISGTVVTFTDLTASHKAESALRESEQRFRNLVETWALTVWETGPDGRVVDDSPSWRAQTGQTLEEWLGDGWLRAVHPDDREGAAREWRAAVAERRPLDMEFRLRRPDGRWSWTNARATPIYGPDGAVRKWAGMNIDISARREAEGRLRASEERLRSATEVAQVGLWDWNLRTDEVTWSDEQFRMSGYEPGEVAPSHHAWLARVHPDDRRALEAALAAARDGQREFVHEFRALHRDNSVHWLSARGRFFYDGGGAAVRMIGAMVEATEARELQQRQEVLVAELQHRTRNLIGVVRSVAEKTAERAGSVAEFRAAFTDRLNALARVQGLLSRMDENERVSFDDLLRTELAAHGVTEDGARVRLSGPAGVALSSGMVQTLALALHELATNAGKHGALRTATARLEVDWRLTADGVGPELQIRWQEHGVAMPDGAADGIGSGRDLIERALPYQLDARTSFAFGPDGIRCDITVPLR
jgi:two-component system, chemotaxis family, CheB/CheR fusion protein